MEEIRFPLPCAPVSYNASAGKHWTTQHKAKHAWQDAARIAALQAADRLSWCKQIRTLVKVAIPVPDKRRRDPHNYVPTVIKPIIDGLVQAGTFIDDSADYLEVGEPSLWVRGTSVVIRFSEAEPIWIPNAS